MRGYSFILYLLLFISSATLAQPARVSPLLHRGEPTELADLLSAYIQIESVSGNEQRAGEFLQQLCAENGLYITPMGDQNGNFNFAASIRPLTEGLPNLIFLNHIDVVPAGDEANWSHPPYSGHRTDTEIWGRGALDNKGAAIIQLGAVVDALQHYRDRSVPYNVTFLAVSCEETQCDGGVRYVIRHFLDLLNPAVVIGEGPPALSGLLPGAPDGDLFGISVAHKRPLWIRIEATVNTSGHGSITPLKYANRELVTALQRVLGRRQRAQFNPLNTSLLRQLGATQKGVAAFALKHPRMFKPLLVPRLRQHPELFALFSNTITLTDLNSHNGVVNVVPPTATALLDCRLLPGASADKFLGRLKRKMRNPDIRVTVLQQMPATQPSSAESTYYRWLSASIRERYPGAQVASIFLPSFSDVGWFRALGIPGFASLPVRMDRRYLECLHHADERMPYGIMPDGVAVYSSFIDKCMKGGIVGLTN